MSPDHLAEVPPGEGGEQFVDADDARQRVLVALSKVGIALRSHAWKDATPRGLNPTQAQVLVVLGRRPDPGLRLADLAAALGVSAPSLSDSVAALERKGLVSKERDPDDGRAISIRPTPEGIAEAASISEWPDLLLSTVDVLGDEERGVFLRALLKMIRELQERGLVSPSRMCATCRYFRPHVHADPQRPHHCAFVDAPFGDANLRLECADHEAATPAAAADTWRRFATSSLPTRPPSRAPTG